LAAVLIAAAAFIGWWADLPLLASWGHGLAAVAPPGAVSLAALGIALVCFGPAPRIAFATGLVGTAIASLNLGLVLFGVQLGTGPETATPVQGVGLFGMRASTSLILVLVGSALVLARFERHHLPAAVLGNLAGAIVVFVLLGDATGINTLYSAKSISSPPLPASVALLCIAFGTILRVGATPAFRRPRPLWHLLAVLASAIVAPLLLFGAYAGPLMADAQLGQIRAGLTQEVHTLSADVDRKIADEIGTLEALAASPSLQHGDFAAFQRQAQAALTSRQRGNIVLFNRSMGQIVNTSVPFGTPLPGAVIAETVQRAFAIGKPQVTGLFQSPVTKEVLFSIVIPVKINGEFRYALARSPSQRAFARVVANQLPPGWNAAVFDAAHRLIAQTGLEAPQLVIGRELPQSQWSGGGSNGVVEFTDAEGRPSLQASTRSELTGWGTAVWAPDAVLGAPLRLVWHALEGMALLAFMLVVVHALWMGRVIARSVSRAAGAATALGEGQPLPPGETPIAEVNTLMEELKETAAKRQAAEGFLRNSQWRLQLALGAAQLGSWQYDAHGRMFSVDARAKEIFDFDLDEVAFDDLLERVDPDDAERVSTVLTESLDPVNPKRSAIEFRIRLRSDGFRWVETYADGAGPERRGVSIVGTCQDITERKEREEREHLLMREMNHRGKNMLSVVDAIAHQTASKSPEDFAARFSERIRALAANQDLLVRNEWRGVDVEGLVRAQLAHFADLVGPRIAMDGPRLRLNAAAAQAIGLAVHELATNAGKYGALSVDAGRVDMRWRLEGDSFMMGWAERNGPPVSRPERHGFGSTVVGSMVKLSVGGEVELDYAPSGLTWRLMCPAANAVEPVELSTSE
jgi:PAS domain S-box-containing protein